MRWDNEMKWGEPNEGTEIKWFDMDIRSADIELKWTDMKMILVDLEMKYAYMKCAGMEMVWGKLKIRLSDEMRWAEMERIRANLENVWAEFNPKEK